MSTPAQTDLAECAAYHELAVKVAAETRTYLARRAFPTERIEENIVMHARFAVACRKADGDEPRVTESKLEQCRETSDGYYQCCKDDGHSGDHLFLKPPLKELDGSYPVVLFLSSREEAEQLEREVKAAKPGMITRQL